MKISWFLFDWSILFLLQNIRDTKLPELNQELDRLKNDIDSVNTSYYIARTLVANASQHANDLKAKADNLNRYMPQCSSF